MVNRLQFIASVLPLVGAQLRICSASEDLLDLSNKPGRKGGRFAAGSIWPCL